MRCVSQPCSEVPTGDGPSTLRQPLLRVGVPGWLWIAAAVPVLVLLILYFCMTNG
jgi:hypothetical protein